MTNTVQTVPTIQTTYGELRNGDQICIVGHWFTVTNIRRYPEGTRFVIRFEGVITDANDELISTSYNGGVYGAFSDITCAVRKGGR